MKIILWRRIPHQALSQLNSPRLRRRVDVRSNGQFDPGEEHCRQTTGEHFSKALTVETEIVDRAGLSTPRKIDAKCGAVRDGIAPSGGEKGEPSAQQKTPDFPGFSVSDSRYNCSGMGDTRLELVTPSLSSNGTSDLSANIIELTASAAAVCTSVCTSDAENANADQHGGTIRLADLTEHCNTVEGNPVAELAAGLLALSAEQRQELAKLLAGLGSS